MSDLPVVVLISGNGSNLQVLIDQAAAGRLPVSIRAVISNRPDAYGLRRAAVARIPTQVIDHRDFESARAFGDSLRTAIESYSPEVVVLAGFMRILHPDLVSRFRNRIINLHPSLLPKYPGLHTHQRALKNGDRIHGASVHFVTEDLDAGPVIIQGQIDVEPGDTPDSLQEKVHGIEHRILPTALRWIAAGRVAVDGDRALLDGRIDPEQGLVATHSASPQRPSAATQ